MPPTILACYTIAAGSVALRSILLAWLQASYNGYIYLLSDEIGKPLIGLAIASAATGAVLWCLNCWRTQPWWLATIQSFAICFLTFVASMTVVYPPNSNW